MPSMLYVCLQDADLIRAFTIDADNGRLTPASETPTPGGPSVTALSVDAPILYVGARGGPSLTSYRIDPRSGALSPLGIASVPDAPTFLFPDRTGKYLLCACYQGAAVEVYALQPDGVVAAPAVQRIATAIGAHAIAADRSNRFVFVPHIARVQDNVLEPPKNIPGPNMIMQFKFDSRSGQLSANSPPQVAQAELIGPRHYTFHPTLDIVYFSNEQGCSVSAYRLDANGTLAPTQTISTLPAGYSERNTCSQIHLTPSGRYLYVGNRGHNSIAGFAVDPATGHLTAAGHVPTEAVPSAFGLDPDGKFLYAAGTASGNVASYRIDEATGALTPLTVEAVGARPAAVTAVPLPG
jgi:6-phosphogluconolactonase